MLLHDKVSFAGAELFVAGPPGAKMLQASWTGMALLLWLSEPSAAMYKRRGW